MRGEGGAGASVRQRGEGAERLRGAVGATAQARGWRAEGGALAPPVGADRPAGSPRHGGPGAPRALASAAPCGGMLPVLDQGGRETEARYVLTQSYKPDSPSTT